MNNPTIRTAVLSCVLLGAALSAAGTLPEASKLLPADTVLYFSIERLEDFRRDFEQTDFYRLSRDPAMKPFVDSLKGQFETMMKEKESRLADLILKENILPEGRVIIAVVQPAAPPGSDDEPDEQALILAQWGRHTEAVRQALNEDIQKEMREGLQRKEDSFRGVPLITVIRPGQTMELPPENRDIGEFTGDEDAFPAFPQEPQTMTTETVTYHYSFVDDVMIFGQAREPVEFAIAHLQGARGETLYDSNPSMNVFRAVDSARPAEFFINLSRLIKEVSFLFAAPGEAEETTDLMGFEGLQALLGVVQPAPGGEVSAKAKLLVHCPAPRKGILKALEMEAGRPALPPFLDPQSSRVYWSSLDLSKVVPEVFRAVAAVSPTMAASLNSPLIPPDSPDSSELFTAMDLAALLRGPILSTEKVASEASEELTVQEEMLIAVGVSDKEKLSSAIAKLHAHFIKPQWPNSRREYLGYPLYVIPAPSFIMEEEEVPTEQPNLNFAWCVTDSFLLAGFEPAVEAALSRISNPTAERLERQGWLQQALRALPGPVAYASCVNARDFGKMLWTSLKDEESDLNWMLEIDGLPEGGLDFSLLPPFEAVQSYFSPTVTFMQVRPEGFFVEMQSLKAVKID